MFRLYLVISIYLAAIAGTLSQESEVQALPAELNKMFVLPCQQPVNDDKTCAWMGGGKLINNYNVQLYPGYKFIGDLETGDCRLEIASVKIEDDGVWKCSKLSQIEGFTVNVTVWATPSKNYLQYRVKGETEAEPLDKTPVMVKAEETYEIDCISQNGRPAVTSIEWFVNNNPIDNANPPDIQSVDGLFTIKSTYELSPQTPEGYRLEGPDGKEKKITCVIHHMSFPEGKQELTATFGEEYKTTQVKIKDANDPGPYTGNIVCDADGIPEPKYQIQKHGDNNEWSVIIDAQNGSVSAPGVYRCIAIYTSPNGVPEPAVSSREYNYKSAKEDDVANDSPASTADVGAIVGIVIGALILLALIGGVTMFTFKRRKLCFKGVEETRGPRAAENGNPQPIKKEQTPMVPDKKDSSQPEGDQNDNMKPKEIVYAELDLGKKNGTSGPQVKPPQQAEKTEYAQIKFQPKENQV